MKHVLINGCLILVVAGTTTVLALWQKVARAWVCVLLSWGLMGGSIGGVSAWLQLQLGQCNPLLTGCNPVGV